jgi:hypothetical protein
VDPSTRLTAGGFGRWTCSARVSPLGASMHRVSARLPGWQQRARADVRSAVAAPLQASVWNWMVAIYLYNPTHGGARGLSGQSAVVVSDPHADTEAASRSVSRSSAGAGFRQAPGGASDTVQAVSSAWSASRASISTSRFGVATDGGKRQRQEGNGRSDAVRLPARGMLRRV